MTKELTLDILKTQLDTKKPLTEAIVDELNNLIEDPDYGEELVDAYISYFSVIEKNDKWGTPKYMSAIKFFTLVESDMSLVDAYCKVFPERLQAILNLGKDRSEISGQASRYNNSKLVNDIRTMATIPVQLIHRHTFYKAIQVEADLMINARSEMVRQQAAATLIKELKPAEEQKMQLDIGVKHSVIDDYEKAILAMVDTQQELISKGGDVKAIANASIKVTDVEIVNEN
jgi:hypothetical protein